MFLAPSCNTVAQIGGFTLHTWPVTAALASIVFIYLGYREAGLLRLDWKRWIWMIIIGIAFALLGMKLYNLYITRHQGFIEGIVSLFTLKGGLDSAGGILGVIAIAYYLDRRRLNIGRYLDTLALPGAILIAISRIGCLCARCETGTITALPWAMQYQDAARHPIAIYYILSGLALFAIFLFLRRFRLKDGTSISLFFILYPLSRVVLDFFRESPPHVILGLSVHQIAYLAMAAVASLVLWRINAFAGDKQEAQAHRKAKSKR
jgi:prolipoprotein diacylglyceryltransferase